MPVRTVFRWLTGSPAAGQAVAPAQETQDNGFVANLPIAAEWINWAWRAIGELTVSAQRFDRLEEAVENLQYNETGIVIEGEPGDPPFWGLGAGSAWSGVVDGEAVIAVSARYLMVLDETGANAGGSFIAERPESSFTSGGPSGRVNITLTNSVTTQRAVATDGVTFVFAHDQYVEAFDATGTSLWVYDHGAAVYDVAVHGGQVLLCGELGTGNHHVRSIAVATGTATWEYQHSASGQAFGICTNGRSVFFGGTASSYSSGATLRAVDFANGADAANEGGTSASTTGLAWDDTNGGAALLTKGIACNGDRLIVAALATFTGQPIQIRAADSGAVIGWDVYESSPSTMAAKQVAIDHRFAYVAQADGATSGNRYGAIVVYNVETGERAYKVQLAPYLTTNNQIHSIATDGRVLWANSEANNSMIRFQLPYRVELVRRVDGDEQGLSWAMELQYVGGR